ncbi:MAG: hypothetical protein JXA46_19190 [Dehalococcoidales bacterium]|nr:hypothetical protein [Dehalococcoidales bacterium]
METEKKWTDLTWQEKREARFNRWLNPENIQFVSPEAEKAYKTRAARFVKAIKLEEPDRVPVMVPVSNFPAYYAGLDLRKVMYDTEALRRAWLKFIDDIGDMDTFVGPGLIPYGPLVEVLDPKIQVWPGHGLPLDATTQQMVEAEYMKADEYDLITSDPSDYHIRVNMPRTSGLLAPFAKLPPLRNLQAASLVAILTDPEIRKTVQTLMDLGDIYKKWQDNIQYITRTTLARGFPLFQSGFPMIPAAYDHFADMLRGTRGIAMDMNRQPQKLLDSMERWLTMNLAMIKGFPMTDCPVVLMPLHKGDDTFMSDKQFSTFYWPFLRRLFMAMIDEGLVPLPFAEGKYNHRLKHIADTPRSGVVWWFDQTDMAEAKRVLGDICCIMGNVPTSVVMTNTTQQVKEYCRRLIETCGKGGGYILTGGACIDNGKMENLRAMIEAADEYGTYKK